MKTKDLIYKLMILDPTGEQECCIENLDIFTIDLLPAYYDGPLQVLIRDPTCPYYNVKSAKYVVSGSKIVLKPISITDAICNDTQLQIDYSQLNKLTQEQYKKSNEKTKQAHIEIENKCELDLFIRWAKEKAFVYSNNRKARLVIHRWPKGIKKCSSKKWFDETNNLLTLLCMYSDYEVYNLMCFKWFDLPEF